MSDYLLYDAAVEAIDDLLIQLGYHDLQKGLDPLNPADFLTISQKLGKAMESVAVGEEARTMKKALAALDVEWSTLTKAQKKAIFAESSRLVASAADKVAPAVEKVAKKAGASIYKDTKASAQEVYGLGIKGSLSDHDEAAVAWLHQSQGVFVRDAFGRKALRFEKRATDIVAEGLEKGLSDSDIANDLVTRIGAGRSKDYWQLVANVFTQRARTYSALSSYHEAGILYYQWFSVMDEATSVQCRFLHGQTFPVKDAFATVQRVITLDDPEEIIAEQPWLRVGTNGTDPPVLYFDRGSSKVPIASVQENATGRANERGKFTQLTPALPAGITMPPAHARCRSTIVPEVE